MDEDISNESPQNIDLCLTNLINLLWQEEIYKEAKNSFDNADIVKFQGCTNLFWRKNVLKTLAKDISNVIQD